jgi:hypothetical protein
MVSLPREGEGGREATGWGGLSDEDAGVWIAEAPPPRRRFAATTLPLRGREKS